MALTSAQPQPPGSEPDKAGTNGKLPVPPDAVQAGSSLSPPPLASQLAPPLPPPPSCPDATDPDLKVGDLVQVSSERHPSRADWGDWGPVVEVHETAIFYQSAKAGPDRVSRKPAARRDCVKLAKAPPAAAEWRKPIAWLSKAKATAARDLWLQDQPLPAELPGDATQLDLAQVDAGCCGGNSWGLSH